MQREIGGEAGAALQAARMDAGLTLEEVATATRIRRDYLSALEEGDCRLMPPKAYAVAYARTYGDFVGLNGAEVAEAMKADYLFAEARELKLVKTTRSRERRIPKGLAGAAAVLCLSLIAMTWYGYNAPSRAAGAATPPAPEALMRWSFEAAPADKSVWSGLAADAGVAEDVWEASAPLPAEPMRPGLRTVVQH